MEVMAEFKRASIGLVPLDWTVSALSELCDVRDGTHESPNFYPDGVPFVTSKNIVNGKIDLENVSYIRKEDAVEFNKRSKVDQGDILMSMIGTIGMAALVDTIPNFCIKNVALLKPKKISPDYLIQLLDAPPFQKYLAESLDGGIQKFISLSTLRSLEIPFPNFTEQSAIATALSEVDALIAGLEKLTAKKRDLKQAAMQQLLTGQTRLPGFSGEWAVKRLGDVGECLRGVSYKGDSDLFPHDTDRSKRLLRSNNVQDSLVVTSDLQHVKVERVRENQILRGGDVLICMANGSKALVGKAGYFEINDGFEYTFGAFMGTYRGNEKANRRFVFYLLQTGRYRDYIANLLAGSSINNLSPSSIESLEFKFPELSEQEAISKALTDMDSELIAIESRLTKTRELKQGMMQELLTGRTRLV